MEDIIRSYWRVPAITRTLTTATAVLSIGVHTGFLPGAWFYFMPQLLLRLPPQIWRLVTCFLITDAGLSMLFDCYWIYKYTLQIETGMPRMPRKADVIWYLMFVCTAILLFNYILGFGFGYFIDALIIALVKTVTQDQRGMKTHFYFFPVPTQMLPYCMMAVNLLIPNRGIMILLQLEGLLAAHLFDFLTRIYPQFGGGTNLIPTPSWLVSLLAPSRVTQRDYGTAVRPTAGSGGSSTGVDTGPLPDSWKTRGRGHRLG